MNVNAKWFMLMIDVFMIGGFTSIALAPYINNSKRARWARALLVATGLLGVASFGLHFVLIAWPVPISPRLGPSLVRIRIMGNG